MFDARLRYSQPITSDIISSRKFHENIKTSLGRNLLRENSASYLTNENGKLFSPFTMKSLPAYLSQLAPMRSRRNRNRGAVAVEFPFSVIAPVLCLAISVNWLPCVAVKTEIEVLPQSMDFYQLASYVAVEVEVYAVVHNFLCVVDDAAKLTALMTGGIQELGLEVEKHCRKSSTCFLEPDLYLKR